MHLGSALVTPLQTHRLQTWWTGVCPVSSCPCSSHVSVPPPLRVHSVAIGPQAPALTFLVLVSASSVCLMSMRNTLRRSRRHSTQHDPHLHPFLRRPMEATSRIPTRGPLYPCVLPCPIPGPGAELHPF